MTAQAIPQAILDFIGKWLASCIQALFSPAEFGKTESETLPNLLGFAASSATVAFILFGLIQPGWSVEQNTPYLIFVVLLWCVICFIISAFIKICGGTQKPAANIAVCLHLTALFYLLEMVCAITAFYFMKNSILAFRISFIALGSFLSLIYLPIILGAMNDLSFGRKTVFTSLSAPLIVGLAVLNWKTYDAPSPGKLSPPPAGLAPIQSPPPAPVPPPAPAPLQAPEPTAFKPPPGSFIKKPSDLATPKNPLVLPQAHNGTPKTQP